jgi:hypothetical protein
MVKIMINIEVVRVILRFLKVMGMGILACLIATAIMSTYYYFQFGTVDASRDLKIWTITGGIAGILAGILTLPRGSLQKNMQSLSLALVRVVIVALSAAGISVAIWYYYRIDYFRLKDDGPLALIIGLIFGMWDLFARTSKSIK